MVLGGFVGGFGWFWVVLGRFGWFWVVPCFSNYGTKVPVLLLWTRLGISTNATDNLLTPNSTNT